MAQNSENRDDERLGTLENKAQWCQTEQNPDTESNRTELYEFPYHYWDTLSRPPNPDKGLVSGLGETIVASATSDSVGRSLTLVTSRQTPVTATILLLKILDGPINQHAV